MTTLIRKAFISNLDSADWMDNRTKKAAKEKVGLNIYIYTEEICLNFSVSETLWFTLKAAWNLILKFSESAP